MEHYERAVGFYEKALGLPVIERKDALTVFGFGRSYLMVERNGFSSKQEKTREQSPVVLRLDVVDFDDSVAELLERGVGLTVKSYPWGRIAFFLDTEGNRIELKDHRWAGGASPKLTIVRTFPFPPARVWQGWTDPALVRRWFGSDPQGTVLGAGLDVRVGGGFEVTFRNSDGTEFTCFGSYSAVVEGQRLAFTWQWKNTPGVIESVDIQLRAEGEGTLMVFEHADIDPDTSHGYQAGWNNTFDKLNRCLS